MYGKRKKMMYGGTSKKKMIGGGRVKYSAGGSTRAAQPEYKSGEMPKCMPK